MKGIKGWIKHHQVLAFFILTYTMSWSVMAIYFLLFSGNQEVSVFIEPLVFFSPALVAMFISGLAGQKPKLPRGKKRWIAFLIAWLFSATVLILYGWKIYHIDDMMVLLLAFGSVAIFPAWVLSSVFSRTPGIRNLLSTLLNPRGLLIWYMVVFLIFPGIPLLGMGMTRLFGGEAEFYLSGRSFGEIMFILALEFLRVFLMTGGINEESGWRGFALPRIQSRFPVFISALIVGFFWSVWHLPLDFGTGVPIAWILENRLIWTLVFSVLMAWLYNRTNGSLLAPVLFHSAMNAFGNLFSHTTVGNLMLIIVLIIVFVSDRMWQKLPSDHPAVYPLAEK